MLFQGCTAACDHGQSQNFPNNICIRSIMNEGLSSEVLAHADDLMLLTKCGSADEVQDFLSYLKEIEPSTAESISVLPEDLYRKVLRARCPESGNTALHVACISAKADTAVILINEGAPVNYKNSAGDLVINIATRNDMTTVVKALLRNKFPVLAQNGRGQTALRFADEIGRTEIARLICNAEQTMIEAQIAVQSYRKSNS